MSNHVADASFRALRHSSAEERTPRIVHLNLKEFREIMTGFVVGEERKVVVSSEFERVTHLVGEELRKARIGFVSLHGGCHGEGAAPWSSSFATIRPARSFCRRMQEALASICKRPRWW